MLPSPTDCVENLSDESRSRIRVGIMNTHSRFLDTPGFEWRSYFRESYDVYARELVKQPSDPEALFDEIIPRLVSDEAIRHGWLKGYQGTLQSDATKSVQFGSYWVNPNQIRLLKTTLQGRSVKWHAEYLRLHGDHAAPPAAERPKTQKELVRNRQELLENYKKRTGVQTNAAIYNAKNAGIHKPQFYQWRKGELADDCMTARNLERFLLSFERPKPRLRRD